MVKHGPCYHCGVTSTPLWRNGPPEKPVLCNACGSRWRTKGTLLNYTPLHAQTEFVVMDANKVYKAKAMPIKKDTNLLKRKDYDVDVKIECKTPNSKQHFNNVFEKEGSNRSSSGSAMSCTESCGHFGVADRSELTGPIQSTIRNSLVPSRKRTCLSRPKHSSVEKLTKELQSILDKQQQSSDVSMSSEEDVLLQSGTLMDSFEIGHGGFLLKYTTFREQEEESDASSFFIDKNAKSTSDTLSAISLLSPTSRSELAAISNDGDGRVKTITAQAKQETTIRNKSFWDELRGLMCNTLPLTTIDRKDVVNREVFLEHLTPKEQNQLMKDLPSLCARNLPESQVQVLKNLGRLFTFLDQGDFQNWD